MKIDVPSFSRPSCVRNKKIVALKELCVGKDIRLSINKSFELPPLDTVSVLSFIIADSVENF